MSLRTVRIGARLGIGFGIILTMLISVLVAGSLSSESSRQKLIGGLQRANAKAALAIAMKSAVLEGGIAMRNIGLQANSAAMKKAEARYQEQRKRFAKAHDELALLGLNDAEKKIADEIVELDRKTEAPLQEAVKMVQDYRTEAAAALIASSIDALNQQAVVEIDKLVELQQAAVRATLDNAAAAGARLLYLFVAMGLAALVAGIVLAWMLTRSITYPLREAVSVARRVAAGELTSQLDVVGKDEVSELLQSLKDMNESLLSIVSEVRGGTAAMATASDEIATGNADLSSRTESQAGALEQSFIDGRTDFRRPAKRGQCASGRFAGDLGFRLRGQGRAGGRAGRQYDGFDHGKLAQDR